DERLSELGYRLGLIGLERLNKVKDKIKNAEEIIQKSKEIKVSTNVANPVLETLNTSVINQSQKLHNLLGRLQIEMANLRAMSPEFDEYLNCFDKETIEQAEIKIKYESYFEKEIEIVEKMKKMEDKEINPNFDYSILNSVSKEAREKLNKIKPRTLGQA